MGPDGSEVGVDSIRPGVHQRAAYSGHSADVRRVACNQDDNLFVTLDERACHIWTTEGGAGAVMVRELGFPRGSYLTAIIFVPKLQLFLAACLEGAIHIYGPDMEPRAQLTLPKAAAGAIVDMVFNPETDELITAGESGVRVWYTAQNTDDWQYVEKTLEPSAQIFRGRQGPWVMGQHQEIRERMTLRVPGTLNVTSNAGQPNKYLKHANPGEWVSKLYIHTSSQVIFCILGISIYGFNAETGVRMFEWEGIHTQPITGMIYQPERNQAFTSSLEPSTAIWRVNSNTGQVQRLRTFGQHAAGVTSIQLHPKGSSMLTSSMDGMVVLWSMQSLEAIYKAKMPQAVTQAEFSRGDDFTIIMGSEVRVLWLEWVQTIFAEYNSPVRTLQYLGKNMVLASYDDSSVRIIDSSSAETLIALPPQLSLSTHSSVLGSPWRSELYVLLTNGQVHCWSIEMQKIPKLSQILNPDSRYRITCAALLEGSLFNPEAAAQFGLQIGPSGCVADHLVVGTSDGDVKFMDLSRSGESASRITVSKVAAITMVRLDPLRARLVTLVKRSLCIWSLEGPATCLREIKLREGLLTMEIANGQLFLAGKSGSLIVLSLKDGEQNDVPAVGDHMGAITALEPNLVLDHIVTAGLDGRLKVFDWGKNLKVSLNLAIRLSAACWLNDNGDLLSASGKRLYKITADRCIDQYRQQAGRQLYNAVRVRTLKATELYSMRGGPVMDILLVGEPAGYPASLPASALYSCSSRPGTSEGAVHKGAGRHRGSQPLAVSSSRAGTPAQPNHRYQLAGAARGPHAPEWMPLVNRMNTRLLMGQPRPPSPPSDQPIRLHQGLPGMKSYGLVPPSSPFGLLKPMTPQVFRDGTPPEVWRLKKTPTKGEEHMIRLGDKGSSASVQTTPDGNYIIAETWEEQESHNRTIQRSAESGDQRVASSSGRLGTLPGSARAGSSWHKSGDDASRRPSTREPLVAQFSRAVRIPLDNKPRQVKGSVERPELDDARALGANAVRRTFLRGFDSPPGQEDGTEASSASSDEGDATGDGDDNGSRSSGSSDDEAPQGLEGSMEEAFHFICKHYDLSEETVRKLLEQEGMLREVAEHGRLLSSAERKATKKKKKKAAPVARETDAGKDSAKKRKKKKKKRRRKRRERALALLGDEGIAALRARSRANGIIIGCHEYNAAEVETHAALRSFLPQVGSPAKKHSKAPVGFQNRIHFPPIPTIAAKPPERPPS